MRLAPWIISLAGVLLCETTFGLRVPVTHLREVRDAREKESPVEKEKAAAELRDVFHQHEKRITCIEDDYLQSLQNFPEDSDPFCRSYINIPHQTSTQTQVHATTITVIATTTITQNGGTLTVPQSIVTSTVTEGPTLKKRQATNTTSVQIIPVASIASSCSLSPQNSSLISAVSSACSCLFITQTTQTIPVTLTTTRTLSGFDYEPSTMIVTVTTPGASTELTTVPRAAPTSPTTSSTASSSSASGTISQTPSSSLNLTSSVGTSVTPSAISSGSIPIPSGPNNTGAPRGESSQTGPSSGSGTPTVLPLSSVNSTSSVGTAVTTATSSNSSGPSTTLSASSTITPTSSSCPVANGTTYTSQCQVYQIECGVNYPGPVTEGLVESDLFACIEACATVNVGFSQSRCYGVTYLAAAVGANCDFKTGPNSIASIADATAISAILLGNSTATNCTSSANATTSSISTGPTILPSGASSLLPPPTNTTLSPFTPSGPTFPFSGRSGFSSTPSTGFPTGTGLPSSGFTSLTNSTMSPFPPGSGSITTPSIGFSTGSPSSSANSTLSPFTPSGPTFPFSGRSGFSSTPSTGFSTGTGLSSSGFLYPTNSTMSPYATGSGSMTTPSSGFSTGSPLSSSNSSLSPFTPSGPTFPFSGRSGFSSTPSTGFPTGTSPPSSSFSYPTNSTMSPYPTGSGSMTTHSSGFSTGSPSSSSNSTLSPFTAGGPTFPTSGRSGFSVPSSGYSTGFPSLTSNSTVSAPTGSSSTPNTCLCTTSPSNSDLPRVGTLGGSSMATTATPLFTTTVTGQMLTSTVVSHGQTILYSTEIFTQTSIFSSTVTVF